MQSDDVPAPVALLRMMSGYWVSTALNVAAELKHNLETAGGSNAKDAGRRQAARGADVGLEEWRSAAACERQHCKPDGYGCFRRGNVRYGFLLEYDRSTERAGQYRAKLMAYLTYLRSGQAARDFEGFPTILFVTTSPTAEERMTRVAPQLWDRMGYAALRIFTTTLERIDCHERGVLGPIWHHTGDVDQPPAEELCWLPDGAPATRTRCDEGPGYRL